MSFSAGDRVRVDASPVPWLCGLEGTVIGVNDGPKTVLVRLTNGQAMCFAEKSLALVKAARRRKPEAGEP